MKYFHVYINKENDQVKIIIDNETNTFPFDELTSVAVEGCPNGISIVYKFEDKDKATLNYKAFDMSFVDTQ